jgi:hypothetical protein
MHITIAIVFFITGALLAIIGTILLLLGSQKSSSPTPITPEEPPVSAGAVSNAPHLSIPSETETHLTVGKQYTIQPLNSGGAATYSIQPANITQLTGLSFNSTTGALSGTLTKPVNLIVTFTAENSNSFSSVTFQLFSDVAITYVDGQGKALTSVNGSRGQQISTCFAKLVYAGTVTPVSGTFIVFGELFGLSFDGANGTISGTPNGSGRSLLNISATLSDGTSSSITLPVIITSSTISNESISKTTSNTTLVYIGAASMSLGVAIIGLGVYQYYKPFIPEIIPDVKVY